MGIQCLLTDEMLKAISEEQNREKNNLQGSGF